MNDKLLTISDEKILKLQIKQAAKILQKDAKVVLFVEPYGSALSLLKRGAMLGYNIIILTANSGLRTVSDEVIELSALSIQVDTANVSKVLSIVKLLQEYTCIDAVIPGFEYFVPIVVAINHYLKLPSIAPQDIMSLRNKGLMREKLSHAGIAMPKYHLVDSMSVLDDAIKTIGFPAVCKPVDAAGSVNVKLVNDSLEAAKAAERILQGDDVLWGHKLANHLLYEEYVAGKEYSVEGTVNDDEVLFFSITEKFVSDEVEFIEVGHIANPPLHAVLKIHIENYIRDVITVLRPNHCPFHAEIRIRADGQPILMEIAARLAGDKIGELINLARGVNYFDYVYAAYFAETKPLPLLKNYYAGIRFFYRPRIEQITGIEGIKEAKEHAIEELCFYYPMYAPIPAFPKPLRRLGHVMMRGDDYACIVETLASLDKAMHFS